MPTLLHTAVDGTMKMIQRSRFYYTRYNNTGPIAMNRVYSRYARDCAEAFRRGNPGVELPPSPLATTAAISLKQVFPADRARELSDHITRMIEEGDKRMLKDDLQVRITTPLATLGIGILDVLKTPAVDQALMNFFRGYYRIESIAASRTLPTDRVTGSWLWHCDTFPPCTCKLFLHLTPANADRGATEFMDRRDTMAFRDAGYFGQFPSERRGDLDKFAREHGIPYRPFHLDAEPGDATLFNQNYFHRAIAPKTAFRDTVQLFFLPNPIPWREQYERDPDFLNRTAVSFPKDPAVPGSTSSTANGMMMA